MALALSLVAAGCAHHARQAAVAPGEPRVLPEHYASSIAALTYPGARRAFQVGNGSVVSTGDAALEWTLPAGAARTSPVFFEKDGVPVAHWWMVSGRESVHFEAAAMPTPLLGDSSLLLAVRATATRLAPGTGEVELEVRVRGRPDGPQVPPWDARDVDRFDEAWVGVGALRNGELVAGVDAEAEFPPGAPTLEHPAHTLGLGPGALVARFRATLARGGQRAWSFWMPAYPAPPALGRRLVREALHPRLPALARVAWRDWLQHAAWLATPDTLVNAAYAAALVTLVGCHERDGEDWVPIGNPFQYRDVWLRDGARTVRALAVAGLGDLAQADAWTLRRFQLPVGAFLSQRGQLDGTGQALWAFDQATAYARSADLARRLLPYAERGFRWLERQRAITRELRLPWAGLLPYGDPRDNELVRAQLVGNDAWALAGYRGLVSLARRAGDQALAGEAAAAYEDYRRAFLAALARTGPGDIPPSWQGGGRDWGNLAVGYPTRVLPADDRRLEALAQRTWRRSGTPGLAAYGHADSLHSYLGADLAQWALLAGRPAAARTALADLLTHSSSTLGQAELFSRVDGRFGLNLPPHTTAAAALVDLIRNMLVSDARDTLELALGGDLRWWNGARFLHAPSRFGMLDVALDRPTGDRLRARWGGVPVLTRVRVPDGARAVEALSPGARLDGERWVECPPGMEAVEFRVAAAADR